MSILFGVLMPEGQLARLSDLRQLADVTAHRASDGTSTEVLSRIGMGFQAHHTHLRSVLEAQPTADLRGNLLTFDGRVDNHAELAGVLALEDEDTSDSRLVLAAFERWGQECFARLHGDWALALWSHAEQALYLARDHAGTRTLYFSDNKGITLWATHLDTFLGNAGSHRLSLEFARAYLSGGHVGDLTPYEGIQAIPPAHYLHISRGRQSLVSHWTPLLNHEIRYGSEDQYDEHFRMLFAQAVDRRIGSRAYPVIAELSGGMDSSSIVCMADQLTSSASNGLVETLSYYDDSEPSWNERPYFAAVEAKRNQAGLHIGLSFAAKGFDPVPSDLGVYRWPGSTRFVAEQTKRVEAELNAKKCRSIVSGIGGDELLGGVPFPLPELADHLAAGRFGHVLSRGVQWCLVDRSPLVSVIYDSFVFVSRTYRGRSYRRPNVPPWVITEGDRALRDTPIQDVPLGKRLQCRPSAIANCFTWRSILAGLPSTAPPPSTRYEYLYPYLDKDLVEFLLRVPNEQLVRPGKRRVLMRRALRGIVPDLILERRRKAYAVRGPLRSLQQAGGSLTRLFRKSRLEEMGLIEPKVLTRWMDGIINGTTTQWWPSLTKTALFEIWLSASMDTCDDHASRFRSLPFDTKLNSLASVGKLG